MNLAPAEFLKTIRKGKRFNLLLLAGEEEFLIRQALDEYMKIAVTPECRDFDFSEFNGRETDAKSLWAALTTMPLMVPQRIVLLDAPSQLEADGKEALRKYLERPSASTSLILVQQLQGKERLSFEPPSKMDMVLFPKVPERERAAWAIDYAKRHDKKLLTDAAEYLIEISGSGLAELASKLDHAFLFLSDETDIDVKTLMKISGITSEHTVFNVIDAIFEQKPAEALKMTRSLLEGGEPLLRLLSVQRGTFFKVWQVLWANEKDKTGKLLNDLFPRGRQDWYAIKLTKASQRFTEARLKAAMAEFLEIEIREKSSTSDTTPRYYELIWRLAGATA
jgi:DNA polymerase III subunit delta